MDKQKSLSCWSLAKTSSWRSCTQGLITRLMLTHRFAKTKIRQISHFAKIQKVNDLAVLLLANY